MKNPGQGAAPRASGLALGLGAVALLLTGAIAGFFYAYSSSVMRGLDATEPAAAIAAMQGINATVRNIVFAPAFFGAPLACLLAAAALHVSKRGEAAAIMALAAIIYLAGALFPTFFVNVPMNDALAMQTIPTDPEAARAMWRDYSSAWTMWNHFRGAVSFVSLLLVGLAVYFAGDRRTV